MVGRVQREFGNQSTIGVFVTSRSGGDETNRVGALDLRWKLSSNWVFAGQAVTSHTNPSGNDGHGRHRVQRVVVLQQSAGAVQPVLQRSKPVVSHDARICPAHRHQADRAVWRVSLASTTGPVVAFGPNTYLRFNWNHAGQLQEWIVRFPFEVHLKGRTQVFVRRVESSELFKGVDLRQHVQTINVTTEWLKWLTINEGFEWGATPNYFPIAGRLPVRRRFADRILGLTFRPTPRLRSGKRTPRPGSPMPFSDNILRSTLNFQFTSGFRPRDRRLQRCRAELVFRGVGKRQAAGRRHAADVQVGPVTAVYIGYTTGFQNVMLSEIGSSVERSAAPTTQVGRQLFMKMSYLIRR